MNYYIVDYENVHTSAFARTDLLNANDEVCVMYTDVSKSFTLDILQNLMELNIRLNVVKVRNGSKDALDFQLSTYLGYILAKEGTGHKYFIVSKDTGYDKVVDFWNTRGFHLARIPDFGKPETRQKQTKQKEQPKQKKQNQDGTISTTKDELLKYLSVEDYSDDILNIINKFKTKQAINNGLANLFKDTEKSGKIYKNIKSLLKEKKKS